MRAKVIIAVEQKNTTRPGDHIRKNALGDEKTKGTSFLIMEIFERRCPFKSCRVRENPKS